MQHLQFQVSLISLNHFCAVSSSTVSNCLKYMMQIHFLTITILVIFSLHKKRFEVCKLLSIQKFSVHIAHLLLAYSYNQIVLFMWYYFRYNLEPSFPHENCHLSERFYSDLDPYHDILPDRDYDIYSKNEYARSCRENLPQQRPYEESGMCTNIPFFYLSISLGFFYTL
jgi:hypothetical protein